MSKKINIILIILAGIILIIATFFVKDKITSFVINPELQVQNTQTEPGINTALVEKSPTGNKLVQFSNSVEHGSNNITNRQSGPEGPELQRIKQNSNLYDCTIESMKNLEGQALVDYLKVRDYDCLRFLWTYDDDVKLVFSTQKMITVLNEIKKLAPTYLGNKQQGIYPLVVFIHIGYYHYFYYPELQFDEYVEQAMINAFDLLAVNKHLNDFNIEAAEILSEYIMAIDSAGLGGHYIGTYKKILREFKNDPIRHSNYYQARIVYDVLYSFQRPISNNYSGKIDQELINLLEFLATNQSFEDSYTYLVNNAIWSLGNLIGVDVQMDNAIVLSLTNALDTYPRLSEHYLWVVSALDEFNNCQTARPNETICKSNLVPELEKLLFPNTYTFDNETLILRTSLDLNTIQPLYHATKEVQAQFNRITNTITPLPNDPNGVLTMLIYGSRNEYEIYQTFLYGLPTNNGGMYMEEDGIFYTYQRTPEESIYTLEELLRHEYTHYLVGRYLIEGLWGEEEIYQNNRMVWFDEGMAEFLTWSNPEGVKVRKILVEHIKNDGGQRMKVSEILTASYYDFKFYRYSALLLNYLYSNQKDVLGGLFLSVHNSDIQSFDTLVDQMKNNPGLEINYQQYLDKQIQAIDSLDNPWTNSPIIEQLTTNDLSVIQTEFRKTRLGYLANCSIAATKMNNRFSCRGYMTGSVSKTSDAVKAWTQVNNGLNEIIQQLRNVNSVNNLQFVNCRMGIISFIKYLNEGTYPIADYYCDGPLAKGDFRLRDKVDQVTYDFHNTRLGKSASCNLIENKNVKCKTTLTTTAYGIITNNAVLEKELERSLIELQNQVYATRPSYYRDFSCNFEGDSKIITYRSSYNQHNKYMIRDVGCLTLFDK